jgi:uncharacterized protein (TIGR03067 family)
MTSTGQKPWSWLLLVAAGLLAGVGVAADEADDQKLLQGTWKPKEAVLGDNKIDPLLLEKASLVIEGDKYTVSVADKEEKGSLTIDAKKTPKTMDIFPTSGDNNGKTLLAIYELAGDKLTVCYSLSEGVRPEDFEADSNTLLVVKYERAK